MINEFDKLAESISYNMIPSNVVITTMTICIKLDPVYEFNYINIGRYLKIEEDFIQEIKYSEINRIITIRGLKTHIKKKEVKKRGKSFYNQITIILKISEIKTINVKIFRNGSLQLTGCNDLTLTKVAIHKLFDMLNTPRYVLDITNKKIIPIDFINIKLSLYKIKDSSVVMINSSYNIDFNIDCNKLYNILNITKINSMEIVVKKNKQLKTDSHDVDIRDDDTETDKTILDKDDFHKYIYEITYDVDGHAGIQIKLKNIISDDDVVADTFRIQNKSIKKNKNTTTIFIFRSGNILFITNSCKKIKIAHDFINVLLLTKYFDIYIDK
jgi:TATA-box binding protein (TBP) (component of TFIID and TFIIIB)